MHFYAKHKKWKIVLVSSTSKLGGLRKHEWGVTVYPDRMIYIRKNLSELNFLTTLIHEIVHAMEFEYGFEIPHRKLNKFDKQLAKAIKSIKRYI